MIDSLVKTAPVAMLAVMGGVIFTLNQTQASEAASNTFEVPVTAQNLEMTKIEEVASPPVHAFAIPADPLEATEVFELELPGTKVAVNATATSVTPAIAAALDEGASQNPNVILAQATGDPVVLDDCEPLMRIDSAEQASLRLLVSAPCHIGQRIEIAHHEMKFASIIDADGGYMAHIPALKADGAVSVTFEDGQTISDAKAVKGIEAYNRVALLIEGAVDFELHVLEAGANYGDPAHVHPGNLRDAETVSGGVGGQLLMLGKMDMDMPKIAQVYSTMVETITRDGVPELTVEARVTEGNCGLDRRGTALTVQDDAIAVMPFEVAVPECEAVGDFLVLPGLFSPMQLASADET